MPRLAVAEPWIDTRDSWLRADIERLSRAGIIRVPVNTWPLMWGGVINDLELADSVPKPLQASYNRVLQAGKSAARVGESSQSIRASGANESQLFRHFGDNNREQGELTLQKEGMSEHFAWNLELTRTLDAWDGDNNRFDNSYFGVVLGNWMVSAGRVERWWGPGWASNLILSNNARPTLGVELQRNYSDPFDFPVLEWLGPWTANMFISELDDDRFVKDAKLVGMSVSIRPHQELEINFRRSAQWGGEGRPQSFSNFLDLLSGIADNCKDDVCKETEPGNQLAGIDIQWNIPWVNGALYVQTIGEDEDNKLPVKRADHYGLQWDINAAVFDGLAFVEYGDTSAVTKVGRYNIIYNHGIYQTGYRYEGRSIGATWDNDSRVLTMGLIGHLANGDKLEASYSQGEINKDSIEGAPSLHSVTSRGGEFNMVSAKWQRLFRWGNVQIQSRYTDELIDEFGRQEDKFRISASVTLRFD